MLKWSFNCRCSLVPRGDEKRFAFSDDNGTSWTYAQEDGYTGRVAWAGGGSAKLWRRERPHMVVDKDGAPLAVSNGVQECLDTGPCPTANDRSWTLVQPVVPKRRDALPIATADSNHP